MIISKTKMENKMLKEVKFDSVGAVIDAVISGRIIFFNKDATQQFQMIGHTIHIEYKRGKPEPWQIRNVHMDSCSFYEEITLEERLETENVWCWISSFNSNTKTHMAIVTDFAPSGGFNYLTQNGGLCTYATPVSAEDLKELELMVSK